MNIFKSTSQHQENFDSKTYLSKGKKMVFATSLILFSCLAFSPAWAGAYSPAKASLTSVYLTGLSIHIGPGGFHVGHGVLYYGHANARSHLHGRFGHQRHWKHSRHFGHRHNYAAPKRFGHRHGWKNDRHRGHFRGKGGRGNGRHRGGRW